MKKKINAATIVAIIICCGVIAYAIIRIISFSSFSKTSAQKAAVPYIYEHEIIKKFFDDHRAWGEASQITISSNWARGKRYNVKTSEGSFLIYFLENRIESVYVYHADGRGRTRVYQYPEK